MLNLNEYANLVRQEGGNKVRMSSKGPPRLGTLFLQILSGVFKTRNGEIAKWRNDEMAKWRNGTKDKSHSYKV